MDVGCDPGDGVWVQELLESQKKQQQKQKRKTTTRNKKEKEPRKLSKSISIPTTTKPLINDGTLGGQFSSGSNNNNHSSYNSDFSYINKSQQPQKEEEEKKKKKTTLPQRKLSKNLSSNTMMTDGEDFFEFNNNTTTSGGDLYTAEMTGEEDEEAEEEEYNIPPKKESQPSFFARSLDFFFDNKSDDVGGEVVETVEAVDDVYSMMYFAPWYSLAFWYGIVVHYLQITILCLALFDMVHLQDLHKNNFLNVPPTATTPLFIAQFLALLVAVLSQDDITHSLLCVSIGFGKEYPKVQKELQRKFPNAATSWQFWLSNTLRFLEGAFTIITSFVFIVQSRTVLDIFLNFAAIEFVSELDNLGFRLAREGWFGKSLRELNKRIAEEDIPIKKQRGFIDYFNQVLLFFTVLCLFLGNALVVYNQKNGYYIKADACSVLDVRFGSEVYDLPPTAALKTYEVNGTIYLGGSTRYIYPGGDPNDPPDLRYSYFNGRYKPNFKDKAGIKNQRPVYYEASKNGYAPDLPTDDSSLAFFYYCEEENAWVWSVRALIDAGAIPQETQDRCKYGWLLRSPITDAVTLEETPREGWDIWTGVLSKTDLSTSCMECRSDIDCGLNRGTCGEDKVCHCHDYATGNFCNEDQPCTSVVGFLNGQERLPPYFLLSNLMGYGLYLGIISVGENEWELEYVYYNGVQWLLAFVPPGQDVAGRGSNMDAHGYWFVGYLDLYHWYTDPTKSVRPTGNLQWYKKDETRSDREFGGDAHEIRKIPIDFHLSCLSMDCDRNSRVCGKFGRCVKDEVLSVSGVNASLFNLADNFTDVVGGKCICDEGYYGHFCEFRTANHTKDEL